MKTILLCAVAALTLVACKKDAPQKVSYRAVCGGVSSCNVEWLKSDGSTGTANLSTTDMMEATEVMDAGDRVHLKITLHDTLLNNPGIIWVFLNGEQLATFSASTNDVARDSVQVTTTVQGQPFTFWRYYRTAVIDREIPAR